MSLKILNHLFTGPFELDKTKVRANQDPAVFAIICRAGEPWNPTFRLIEVGDSGEDGITFKDHPGRNIWEESSDGTLSVYLLSFPRSSGKGTSERQSVVDEIRSRLDPPNGIIPIQGMM